MWQQISDQMSTADPVWHKKLPEVMYNLKATFYSTTMKKDSAVKMLIGFIHIKRMELEKQMKVAVHHGEETLPSEWVIQWASGVLSESV